MSKAPWYNVEERIQNLRKIHSFTEIQCWAEFIRQLTQRYSLYQHLEVHCQGHHLWKVMLFLYKVTLWGIRLRSSVYELFCGGTQFNLYLTSTVVTVLHGSGILTGDTVIEMTPWFQCRYQDPGHWEASSSLELPKEREVQRPWHAGDLVVIWMAWPERIFARITRPLGPKPTGRPIESSLMCVIKGPEVRPTETCLQQRGFFFSNVLGKISS